MTHRTSPARASIVMLMLLTSGACGGEASPAASVIPETILPIREPGNPFMGDVLFVERFDDVDFQRRGWYDSSGGRVVPGGAVGSNGTHALLCRFEAGRTGCADGTPGRRGFDATESVFLSYRIRYDDGWVGSERPYHPHEFYLLTNVDEPYVGPARTHLTVYVEQVGGTPLVSLQDSRNVDVRCILRNDDALVGCSGFSIRDFPFSENRSVAACNGLLGDVQGRDCYPTGPDRWYSSRTWRSEHPVLRGPGPDGSEGWRLVEAFFEMNSIENGRGVPDGQIRLWVDEELVFSSDRVLFRTGQHPDMAFNQLLLAPYMGDGSPVEQSLRIGEIVVARGAQE